MIKKIVTIKSSYDKIGIELFNKTVKPREICPMKNSQFEKSSYVRRALSMFITGHRWSIVVA